MCGRATLSGRLTGPRASLPPCRSRSLTASSSCRATNTNVRLPSPLAYANAARTDTFKAVLPSTLPPSHRGRALRISYRVVITVHRDGAKPDVLMAPFRLLQAVADNGATHVFDFKTPCLLSSQSCIAFSQDEYTQRQKLMQLRLANPAAAARVLRSPASEAPDVHDLLPTFKPLATLNNVNYIVQNASGHRTPRHILMPVLIMAGRRVQHFGARRNRSRASPTDALVRAPWRRLFVRCCIHVRRAVRASVGLSRERRGGRERGGGRPHGRRRRATRAAGRVTAPRAHAKRARSGRRARRPGPGEHVL